MSTLTKSWLQKQITDLEATRDEIPFGLDEDGNNTLDAFKMALAGMEAVPVAWKINFILEGQPGSNFDKIFENSAAMNDAVSLHKLGGFSISITPLYAEPQPATVVPELKQVGYLFVSEQGAVVYSPTDWGMDGFSLVGQIFGDIAPHRAAMLQGKAEPRDSVRRDHAEWSQSTFGNVGPVGPLKHLSKEALEAAAEPGDLSEWADMQLLLWDAQRRAGITDDQITEAMIEKLAVNKARIWPEPKDGEPRLHIKAAPQQEA